MWSCCSKRVGHIVTQQQLSCCHASCIGCSCIVLQQLGMFFIRYTAHHGLGLFILYYSVICRPSDHTAGRPGAEIQTRDGRSRGLMQQLHNAHAVMQQLEMLSGSSCTCCHAAAGNAVRQQMNMFEWPWVEVDGQYCPSSSRKFFKSPFRIQP